MTTIFYTQCNRLDLSQFKKGLSILPIEFQKKILKYKRWQDAHASLYGKLLLKEGLKQMGFECKLTEMKLTQFGKPYLTNDQISFNISHSYNYILCAISSDEKKNLGIDIEKIKPIEFNDFQNIWSLNEKQNIISLKSFYEYWTRKEAIIKAVGKGMYIPLNKIDTSKPQVHYNKIVLFLQKIYIAPNYIAHVASTIKINDVQLKYLSFQAIKT